MDTFDLYTARDLRNRAGGLLRQAESGGLSLITRRGRPMAVAIPFDNALLEHGVHRRLAIHLFVEQVATLSQAARIASMSIEAFLEELQLAGVDVVDYPPEELEDEIAASD